MSSITPSSAPTISTVEAAALQILAAPINAALTAIISNPTSLNVAGQVAALQGELIAAAPALETLGIKDGATAIQVKFNAYIASLTSSSAS